MTQQQADSLKKLLPTSVIIGSSTRLDDMMRQAAAQSNCHVDCMTVQRLDTLLSEGMSVIMWEGWVGEGFNPVKLEYNGHPALLRAVRNTGAYTTSLENVYYKCFDPLDRHEGEVPSGVIVDTLVAPYLALVIPGSNT